jgi:hypothetical protein
MNPTRMKILLGIAAVLAIGLLWNWISGWGLVTVHVQDKPVADVIRSIERQGGIKIVTNAPADAVVSMDVDKVKPVDAVDVLAARIDGNWSIGYMAGASKTDVEAGLTTLASGERGGGLRTFGLWGGGGGGFGGDVMGDVPVDARLVEWSVSPMDTSNLQSYLDQLSVKTGLMAAVPEGWNPDLSNQPSGGKAGDALKALVKSVKGAYQEIFVVRVMNRERFADGGRNGPGAEGGFGGPRQDGGFNPPERTEAQQQQREQWMQERVMARLDQLPVEEREQAKKEFDEMRAMFDKIRELPEDQRRTAMQNLFENPAMQERMAERAASRDEKSGPERRAERSRRYVQRKQEMKAQQGQ